MSEGKSDRSRTHYLQVKVNRETRIKISDLAKTNHRPSADIIRGALYFGLPMLEYALKMETKLTELIIKSIPGNEVRMGRPSKDIFNKFL
ncbi:MAG: hypothetical protein GF315_06125 [candidate division Zixibacteria bacterium]|nr:hypothetical protein [candidate division Zixibacteria bacterium]